MTLENNLRLLKHFEKVSNDEEQKASVRKQSKLNFEMMKKHLDKSRKYQEYLKSKSKEVPNGTQPKR